MATFMAQHHHYGYPMAPVAPPPSRQYAGHGTSSAFSSSANPDEDWTKISDLAERRRIQNRIAQRNYRKKLKRRLEDLQRRAGSPEDGESDKTKDGVAASATAPKNANNKITKSPTKRASKPAQKLAQPQPMSAKPINHHQFTPPMEPQELMFHGDRSRSHTPPMFSYSSYPPADDFMVNPYSAPAPQYSPAMTTAAEPYPGYLAATAGPAAPSTPVPVTMPSMSHFNDAVKRDVYVHEDSASSMHSNPYMSYGYVPGMDIGIPSPYESNPQTPPLSHSYDHLSQCSDNGYEYPTTPLSMPESPEFAQHY